MVFQKETGQIQEMSYFIPSLFQIIDLFHPSDF